MSDPQDELRVIALDKIKPWAGNPRKTFPEAAIAELAASIQAQGLLQPLLLRPHPAGVGAKKVKGGNATGEPIEEACGYELADGERRWRAARAAGLKAVPAVVRSLSDQEMLEISLVSEGQRQDLSAAERADGIGRLVDHCGGKVEAAAAKLGKSASAVRAALRLKLLPEGARQALDEGRISLSVAELIAARPSQEMRAKVAAFALQPADRWGYKSEDGELPSCRALKEFVRQHCMIELKQAPFNQKEDGLAGAPSCQACPQRTGNARDQYPDGREDLCTDPACYRAKLEAWQQKKAAEAQAKGTKLLPAEEAAKLFGGHGDLVHGAPYFDYKDLCWEDKKAKRPRTYKQLLEAHVKYADVVLAADGEGRLHQLVHKDVALPLLRAHYGLFKDKAGAGRGQTSDETRARLAEARERNDLERRTHRILLARAAERGLAWGKGLAGGKPEVLGVLQAVTCDLVRHTDSARTEQVCRRRGLKASGVYEQQKLLNKAVQDMAPADLVALLTELTVARHALGFSLDGVGRDVLKLIGMTEAEAKQQAAQEIKAKRGPKTAGRVGPRPGATAKKKGTLGTEGKAARKAGQKILAAAGGGQ